MTNMVLSLAFTAVFVLVGAIAGGLLLAVAARALRAPDVGLGHAFSVAAAASIVSGAIFVVVVRILDDTRQPPVNTAFYAGAVVGVLASFVISMRMLNVEMSRMTFLWLPFGILMGAMFYVLRTESIDLRERMGLRYRGFERIANLHLLDPPDAMSTFDKAISYYNAQVKTLRTATEDTGIGKVLTAQSHWDAQWFLDNFQFIMARESQQDITGITKVVTDPAAHKAMAMLIMSKPIYGSIDKSWQQGNDGLVQMTSGQIVRFYREGQNWKVRDWLGMRTHMTREIHDVKAKNNAATPEDEAVHRGQEQATEELKQLCARAGIEYEPFDPYFDEEEETRPGMGLLGKSGRKRRKPATTGYTALDTAKPGELVDVSAQPTPAPAPAPAAPPPQPTAERELTVEEKLAIANRNLDAAAAMMQVQPPAQTALPIQPAQPTPSLEPQPDTGAPVTVTPTPVPTPFVLENIPVENLWPRYVAAIAKIQANDPKGIAEFLNCLATDDATWLTQNLPMMARMLAPESYFATPEEASLFALKAVIRNMPTSPAMHQVRFARKPGSAVGVVEIEERTGTAPVRYRTAVVQEGGRWVVARLFFARPFVWLPQLAWYKQAAGIPLAPDEQLFLVAGQVPFQDQVRQVYAMTGYGE